MENTIYILFISIFIPILFMSVLVERKARLPIIFVLIGIFISVFAAEINGFICHWFELSVYEITVYMAPITEELLKATPIIYFAIVVSSEKEKLFTAAMATGVGFAILENAYYMLENAGTFNLIDAIIRAFGAGLMHGMCTLLVGVGITLTQRRKKVFPVMMFALLSTAITYHAIYNMLVQSEYQFVGFAIPIATYIPFFIWRYKLKRKLTMLKNDLRSHTADKQQ